MKDDGRIPRIKDTDMTDRLLTAGAIAEDTRNPIGDIAACFPGHGSQSVGMFHGCLSGFPEARQAIARAGQRSPTCLGSVAISMRWDQPSHPSRRGPRAWLDLRPHPSWDGAGTYGPDGVFHP